MVRVLSGQVAVFRQDAVNYRFFIDNRDDLIQGHFLRGSLYEIEELSIIKKYFQVGGRFVDVGANVGNHSIYVAKKLQATEVICFEPNPAVIETLKLNILLNQVCSSVNTEFLGIGLGSNVSAAGVHYPQERNLGAAQLRPGTGFDVVPVIPGDTILRERLIDFIKIDVEGMELDVLNGLKLTLENSAPSIFVEVDNTNKSRFLSWLGSSAYEISTTYQRYPHNENYMLVPRQAK